MAYSPSSPHPVLHRPTSVCPDTFLLKTLQCLFTASFATLHGLAHFSASSHVILHSHHVGLTQPAPGPSLVLFLQSGECLYHPFLLQGSVSIPFLSLFHYPSEDHPSLSIPFLVSWLLSNTWHSLQSYINVWVCLWCFMRGWIVGPGSAAHCEGQGPETPTTPASLLKIPSAWCANEVCKLQLLSNIICCRAPSDPNFPL